MFTRLRYPNREPRVKWVTSSVILIRDMLYLLKSTSELKDYYWYKPVYAEPGALPGLPDGAEVFATRPDGCPTDALLVFARFLVSSFRSGNSRRTGVGWCGSRKDPRAVMDIFLESLDRMARAVWIKRGVVYRDFSDLGMFGIWKHLVEHYGYVEGPQDSSYVDDQMGKFRRDLEIERTSRRAQLLLREVVSLEIPDGLSRELQDEFNRESPDLDWIRGAVGVAKLLLDPAYQGTKVERVIVVSPEKVKEIPFDRALAGRIPLDPGYAYSTEELFELEDCLAPYYGSKGILDIFPGISPAILRYPDGRRIPGYMYVPGTH
nr:MAG TPA: hypothetical protein [Caudoviricetes sp.]